MLESRRCREKSTPRHRRTLPQMWRAFANASHAPPSAPAVARTTSRWSPSRKLSPPKPFAPPHDAGLRHFGENRVQEIEAKRPKLAALDATWHFIGHLQSNKARLAAAAFRPHRRARQHAAGAKARFRRARTGKTPAGADRDSPRRRIHQERRRAQPPCPPSPKPPPPSQTSSSAA